MDHRLGWWAQPVSDSGSYSIWWLALVGVVLLVVFAGGRVLGAFATLVGDLFGSIFAGLRALVIVVLAVAAILVIAYLALRGSPVTAGGVGLILPP